jgi:uncharacterized protein
MQRTSKFSSRSLVALAVYIVLLWGGGKCESKVLSWLLPLLRDHLHLSFKAIGQQRPAVPVNVLTAIVLVRLVAVLLATLVAAGIERRPWRCFGYGMHGAAKPFAMGGLLGFAAISVVMALMAASHALIFDGRMLHGAAVFNYGLRWLAGLMLVGVVEEGTDRAYPLVTIARSFGMVPAVLLTSLVFAWGHAGNPGEGFLGLLQVFLFGTVCALSVFRTGSIWWAVAFHGIWDWAQEFFYGTLGSGYWFDGHLFQFRAQGNVLLSGGTVGPEGSLYVFVVLGALLAYEIVWQSRNSGAWPGLLLQRDPSCAGNG